MTALLFLNAVSELFNDRVGQHFTRNTLYLGLGLICSYPILKRESKVLTLAHTGNLRVADLAEGILDGLPLRIQDRCLQSDIDREMSASDGPLIPRCGK